MEKLVISLARIAAISVRLSKVRWEVMVKWKIQAIQPYHGISALMSMIMPLPLRCQDDVSSFHIDSSSLDGRKRPTAFNDKA